MERLATLNKHFDVQNTAFGVNEFRHITQAPADPILFLSAAYKTDKDPKKVNLGIGAYRTDMGKPYVFPIVKKVELEIVNDLSLDKEYSAITGNDDFCKGARGAVWGFDNDQIHTGRIISSQTLSGTGALRVVGEFLHKFRPAPIYLCNPSWANHAQIFKSIGMDVRQYTYYNAKTKGFNLEGMLNDLRNAPSGSTILLHAVAHNPTGVDPTPHDWAKIAEVMKFNNLFPFFDTAYQGFASGDLAKDGASMRYFLKEGFQMVVAQSFAKTMGLYGERTGAMHVVCSDKATADKVASQIKVLIRSNYSSPPLHGARIAAKILNNVENRNAWLSELKAVTVRMNDMRVKLQAKLQEVGAKGNWDHVTGQIGMFSFTGLTVKQSEAMISKHHIYMTKNGRISIAGLTNSNVEYVAKAIKDVAENF